MNDNPGREREEPETDPENLDLDDDELLRRDELEADDDVEIPGFLTENAADNTPPSGPTPGWPVPLSSIFRDPPPLFPPDEDASDIESSSPDFPRDPDAPVPPSSLLRDPTPRYAEDSLAEEELETEEFATLDEFAAVAPEPDEGEAEYGQPAPLQPSYEPEDDLREEEPTPLAAVSYEEPADDDESEEAPLAAASAADVNVEGAPAEMPRFRRTARSLPSFEPSSGGRAQAQPQVFTVFKPESSSGSFLGVVAVVFCLVVGVALIFKSFGHDPSLAQFFPLVIGPVLLFLGTIFAYWTWGSLSLRYVIDRNALTIRWGAQRQIVPLVNIERLIPADPEGDDPDIRGVDWPGHHVGTARVAQLGEVLFYSGHRRASDILYVQTSTETYGISVPDPVAFAQAVQSNQMRGSLFEQRQAVHRDGIAAQSFWIDSQARFLTVILLAAFVMVLAYVLQTYPGLTQSVPLRFPALGGLLRVTDKSELLDIPRSAAVFLGLNLALAVVLHPWERMVSIVLLLAGIAIQIALLVAAIVAVA